MGISVLTQGKSQANQDKLLTLIISSANKLHGKKRDEKGTYTFKILKDIHPIIIGTLF